MGARYGRYETIRRIAAGGMATVHLGRTQGPGGFERLVAVKVMHEHIAADPAFRDMFLDEARLCARIRHPNVVATIDVAEDGRFIVMEYIEGAALDVWLQQRREQSGEPLELGVTLRVMLDVLGGLHAAHELRDADGAHLRLVHRDVSPQNVLVGVDGVSRVGDFGIAYAASRLASTRGSQLKGKLPYMAPEQLEDGAVDRRADVYAAGCVLWEMLTGRRLFTGSNEAAVACAVLAGPEQSAASLADVPAEIDAACMRALQSPAERFDTALAFAQALEQAAEAAGVKLAHPRELGAQIAALSEPHVEPSSSAEPSPGTSAVDEADEGAREAAAGSKSLHTETGIVAPAGVPQPMQRRSVLALVLLTAGLVATGAWLLSGSNSSEPSDLASASTTASPSARAATSAHDPPALTAPQDSAAVASSAATSAAPPISAALEATPAPRSGHTAPKSPQTASRSGHTTSRTGHTTSHGGRTTSRASRATPPAAKPAPAPAPPPPPPPAPAPGYHPELP